MGCRVNSFHQIPDKKKPAEAGSLIANTSVVLSNEHQYDQTEQLLVLRFLPQATFYALGLLLSSSIHGMQ
jgi:hypothetical protein